jgi:hypothetical protein
MSQSIRTIEGQTKVLGGAVDEMERTIGSTLAVWSKFFLDVLKSNETLMQGGVAAIKAYETAHAEAIQKITDYERGVLNVTDELTKDNQALERASETAKSLVLTAKVPAPLKTEIRKAYRKMSAGDLIVAVRSSATAEDLPEASFAGQQATFLKLFFTREWIDLDRRFVRLFDVDRRAEVCIARFDERTRFGDGKCLHHHVFDVLQFHARTCRKSPRAVHDNSDSKNPSPEKALLPQVRHSSP